MLVISNSEQANAIPHPEQRLLVLQRITMLSQDEPYDPDVCGYFVVVESGDDLIGLNRQLGFDVQANRFNGTHFGHLDFVPAWEILEEHASCYEVVFILSDDGFGVVVFVPKDGDIPPGLLAMCRQYAVTLAAAALKISPIAVSKCMVSIL